MIRALIAMLGGMLIGLERERAQLSSKSKIGGSMPGMRSFGLLSVYGALTLYMATEGFGAPIMIAAFSALIGLVLLYAYSRLIRMGVQGITTYIVMLIAFLSGGLAGSGMILESAGISVLTTLILALKRPAEKAATAISYEELIAIIEVASLALIIGPIVKAYSESVDITIIFKSYLFFIIILMLSLTTYMAARIWGARGILYSAVLGALVNSEATLTSILEKAGGASSRLMEVLAPLVIIVAQLKLVVLAIVGVIIFSGALAPDILVILLLTSVYLLAGTYLLHARASKLLGSESMLEMRVEVSSPVSWGTAVKGAFAYTVITAAFLLISKVNIPLASMAPVLFSFLGGLISATAVILSLGTTIGSMPTCVVGTSILAVLTSVSLNKILYANAARAERELKRIVYKWSILLSIAPLLLTFPLLASC
ncbi:MAG: DUF4010 domain-containing protein [Desulfurococcales archaeon]|nr:DUF4010 domain-containing protein [Desulfurococcales archaeon]